MNAGDTSNTSAIKRSESESSGESEVQSKKLKLAEITSVENTNATSTIATTTSTAAVKPSEKKNDLGKEAAIEAEVRAARERALVPLETRVTQFKDMLKEKDVSEKKNNL